MLCGATALLQLSQTKREKSFQKLVFNHPSTMFSTNWWIQFVRSKKECHHFMASLFQVNTLQVKASENNLDFLNELLLRGNSIEIFRILVTESEYILYFKIQIVLLSCKRFLVCWSDITEWKKLKDKFQQWSGVKTW